MAKGNTDTLGEVQEVQLWENQTTKVKFGSAPPEHAGKFCQLPCSLGFSLFVDILLARRYADNYGNEGKVDKICFPLVVSGLMYTYLSANTSLHPR